MRRLATQARNRLHAALHRARLLPPEGNLFGLERRTWWAELPVSTPERVRIQSDLATLDFAEGQVKALEDALAAVAAAEAHWHASGAVRYAPDVRATHVISPMPVLRSTPPRARPPGLGVNR